MIISRKNIDITIILKELNNLKNKNLNLIINEFFLHNGQLKDSNFEIDYIDDDNLWMCIKEKLKNYYELSLNYNFEEVNIYKLKVVEISIKDELIYYLKYELVNKSEKLFFLVKNNNIDFVLKNLKQYLDKIIIYLSQKKSLIIHNQIKFIKIYKINYLLKKLKKIITYIKFDISLSLLITLNLKLKNKIKIFKKSLYKIFIQESIKIKNEIKIEEANKIEIMKKWEHFKNKRQEKLNKLITKKNKSLEANQILSQNIIQYFNYQIKNNDLRL